MLWFQRELSYMHYQMDIEMDRYVMMMMIMITMMMMMMR